MELLSHKHGSPPPRQVRSTFLYDHFNALVVSKPLVSSTSPPCGPVTTIDGRQATHHRRSNMFDSFLFLL